MVKKPRAFVDESDIFDFSGMKQIIEKTEDLTILKNVSDAPKKIERSNTDKKLTEASNDNFGNLFLGKSQGAVP
jgi:hypothetical protein